jgi:hypothetical protein
MKLAIVAAIVLTAAYVSAQQVMTHYAGGYNLANDKTFYVDVMTKWDNPTNEEYAKQAVVRKLTEKGYVQVTDRSSADLLVMIHGATKDKTSVQNFYSGTGVETSGWAGPAGVVEGWETEYKVGTGVIDIFDSKTKRLVFRGSAEDEISMQGEQNQMKIDKAVDKIFKDFPKSKAAA